MSATTGPSPACRVCTWVSVTLNGASTLTSGAVVSVDPVTATLPVAPGSVHSGVPPFSGAAVGHALAAVAVSVTEDATTSATEGVLADEGSVSEPHAASVMTNDAAQATSATEEDTREEFTVVTLQPHYAALAGSPDWDDESVAQDVRIHFGRIHAGAHRRAASRPAPTRTLHDDDGGDAGEDYRHCRRRIPVTGNEIQLGD